ncbi:LOW QUALITY PROTEIN: hypothetical protein V1478_014750 [Vespula squamosa]|uniref:Uncharacterized protein n=1 Tax=Vespula squamosa TaxID=30214 RepID=A0ABD2A348_VESSQ
MIATHLSQEFFGSGVKDSLGQCNNACILYLQSLKDSSNIKTCQDYYIQFANILFVTSISTCQRGSNKKKLVKGLKDKRLLLQVLPSFPISHYARKLAGIYAYDVSLPVEAAAVKSRIMGAIISMKETDEERNRYRLLVTDAILTVGRRSRVPEATAQMRSMVKRLMKEKPSSSRLLFRKCGAKARTKAWRRNATSFGIVHSRSSGARDDNKVGPSNDFVDFWHSFALTFDECTSQLPRDAFPGSDKEGETQFGIVHWRSSGARDDNKVGPSNDFVDFWHSFALTFDECTSQLPRDAFPGSDKEGETQFGIVHWRSSGARDDNKVGPSNDFVDFWHSFALTFDECTSQLPREAFPGSDKEGETQFGIVHWRSSRARDDNKFGPSNDFVDFWHKGMSPFFRTRMIGKTLTRVTAGTRVGVSGASLSPTEDCVLIFEISKYRHDRSCLEMSEADGVDGGAFRKRGLTHLQWAEKPEAPEAERHLGTRISRVGVSPWVPECSNLLAVGPGSEILALHGNLMGSNSYSLSGGTHEWGSWGMSPFFRTRKIGKTLTRVTAGTRVGVSGASLSPTEDCVLILISKYRHDRSCLEMSEADGVDGGAFRKRGLTHLQWAEKPEAPEAERHLESALARGSPNAATSSRWDLGRKYLLYMKIFWEASISERIAAYFKIFAKFFLRNSKLKIEVHIFYIALYIFQGMSPFFRTRTIGKTLTRVTAGTRVGVRERDFKHDRSCLEMSEADGVDGGAFRKRGLTHLQWAEKPEAPEAERHLGTRIRWCPRARLSPSLVPTYSTCSRECFRDTRVSIVSTVGFNLGSRRICRESTTGRVQVLVGPQMQLPPRGGTWVGSTCNISISKSNI